MQCSAASHHVRKICASLPEVVIDSILAGSAPRRSLADLLLSRNVPGGNARARGGEDAGLLFGSRTGDWRAAGEWWRRRPRRFPAFSLPYRAGCRNRGWRLVLLFAGVAIAPALLLARFDGEFAAIDLYRKGAQAGSLVVFLALLPAVNAPFDWFSLGITRFFIGRVAQDKEGGWLDLLQVPIIVGNLVLALILAGLVAITTAAGVAVFSRLEVLGGTEALYSVSQTIERIRADPGNKEFWWIYGMMGWTLLPTLTHIVAFAGALVALFVKLPGIGNLIARSLSWAGGNGILLRILFAPAPALLLTLVRIAPGLVAIGLLIVFRENALGALYWALKFVWGEAPQNVAGWGSQILDWSLGAARAIEGASEGQLALSFGAVFAAAIPLALSGPRRAKTVAA